MSSPSDNEVPTPGRASASTRDGATSSSSSGGATPSSSEGATAASPDAVITSSQEGVPDPSFGGVTDDLEPPLTLDSIISAWKWKCEQEEQQGRQLVIIPHSSLSKAQVDYIKEMEKLAEDAFYVLACEFLEGRNWGGVLTVMLDMFVDLFGRLEEALEEGKFRHSWPQVLGKEIEPFFGKAIHLFHDEDTDGFWFEGPRVDDYLPFFLPEKLGVRWGVEDFVTDLNTMIRKYMKWELDLMQKIPNAGPAQGRYSCKEGTYPPVIIDEDENNQYRPCNSHLATFCVTEKITVEFPDASLPLTVPPIPPAEPYRYFGDNISDIHGEDFWDCSSTLSADGDGDDTLLADNGEKTSDNAEEESKDEVEADGTKSVESDAKPQGSIGGTTDSDTGSEKNTPSSPNSTAANASTVAVPDIGNLSIDEAKEYESQEESDEDGIGETQTVKELAAMLARLKGQVDSARLEPHVEKFLNSDEKSSSDEGAPSKTGKKSKFTELLESLPDPESDSDAASFYDAEEEQCYDEHMQWVDVEYLA